MIERWMAMAGAMALAACAAEPAMQGTVVAADPAASGASQQNCAKVYRVGSNIPVVNCQSALTEQEKQRLQSEVQGQTRPKKPPGT